MIKYDSHILADISNMRVKTNSVRMKLKKKPGDYRPSPRISAMLSSLQGLLMELEQEMRKENGEDIKL